MALYDDIFNDKEKVKLDYDYFYVMVDSEAEKHPVPTYVFPDFKRFYNMMYLESLVRPGVWKMGRIPIKKDFFSSRLPYLKRFLNRQEETLLEYEKTFGNDRRPTDQMTENDLRRKEIDIFGYKG